MTHPRAPQSRERLLELAAQCEAASGPGCELNTHIWSVVNPKDAQSLMLHAPKYTASLDAAMTLLPGGDEIELTNLYCVARATIGLNSPGGPFYGNNECNSLPLALCAAALKARAAEIGRAEK